MSSRPTMLDTNVLSELLRRGADRRVIAFIEEQRDPIVCATVFHELTYGVKLLPVGTKKASLSAGIETFRRRFRDRTINMDAEIAEISGRLRAGETRSGPIDASAIVVSARLATRNIKDFERLGIELVNPWVQ